MAKDPNTAAQRWANNLGAATEAIKEGVMAVSTAPGQAASRQKSVWQANTTAAADKWANNTSRVTLQDWQQSMVNKGVNRIAQGAAEAQPKMAAFLTAFIPHVEAGKRALPPRGGLEQNLQRMVAMARHNAKFGQSGSRA